MHKEVIFFLAETHTEKVELSYEHVGYIWLDYQSALEKLTFRNAKMLLEKAHELLKAQGIISS